MRRPGTIAVPSGLATAVAALRADQPGGRLLATHRTTEPPGNNADDPTAGGAGRRPDQGGTQALPRYCECGLRCSGPSLTPHMTSCGIGPGASMSGLYRGDRHAHDRRWRASIVVVPGDAVDTFVRIDARGREQGVFSDTDLAPHDSRRVFLFQPVQHVINGCHVTLRQRSIGEREWISEDRWKRRHCVRPLPLESRLDPTFLDSSDALEELLDVGPR